MKISLNYFSSGACVKFDNNDINILIVKYYDSSDHKRVNEIRLPGGTVQFNDIEVAFKKVASTINLSLDKFDWILNEIKVISSNYKRQTETMPFVTNMDKILVRNCFTKCLTNIEEAIDTLFLDDRKIKVIQNECKLATLRRELLEETATTTFEDALQCDFMERNGHFQYPFLVLGSDAPDHYTGSSDEDIEESYYLSLDEVSKVLYRNHQPFLRNTLTQLSQILQYDDAKKHLIKKIEKCLLPN